MIQEAIEGALASLDAEGVAFSVEYPPQETGADYASNAALAAAKTLGKPPREVAEELRSMLRSMLRSDVVSEVVVAGPGFLNFTLAREAYRQGIEIARGLEWECDGPLAGRQVLIEYTDPNPFKEFHIGHLMSNAIGESIARVLHASGAQVTRANYQGDVGPHVAKALWGKMQQPHLSWGAAYAYGASHYDEHKEEIQAINAKVYDRSDPAINDLYDHGRRESLAHFETLYKTLGTEFDLYFFESETSPRGLSLVRAHPDVFEESDGAIVYHGTHTRVFITSQGLPTYETKDLGLLELKSCTVPVDRSITITGNEQKDYFAVILDAARKIPELSDIAAKTEHIPHGLMRFASGKMSSREGKVITGESLLEDLRQAAREKMGGRELQDADAVANAVAVAAIKFAVLKQGSGKDIIFDPEQSLSLEGDSGPYVQYAHTRCKSLLRKAADAGVVADVSQPTSGVPHVERLLMRFPEVVKRAAEEYEPHHVAQYLLELAGAFNSWYANERVLGTPEALYKLALVEGVCGTLKKGLTLLGIEAPEEM